MPRTVSATSRKFMELSEVLVQNGYIAGPRIGTGNYAQVRVIERIADAALFAGKVIDREKAPTVYIKDFLPRELKVIQSIQHENIVGIHDIIHGEKIVIIIMDYAGKGDLLELIRNMGPPALETSRKMFREIVNVVKYLHDNEIVHRDLKCENILLKRNGGILLSDFGFARKFDDHSQLSKTYCGSAAYASPQLVTGVPYNPRENDVWSLGCILYILVTGFMPFDDSNVIKMVMKQKMGASFPAKVRDKVDPKVRELIKHMLEPDPTKRATVNEILAHHWLQEEGEKT